MGRIDTFLELVVKQNGSDLHLVSGNPPMIRLYGDLFRVKYRELTAAETTDLLCETMTAEVRQTFQAYHGVDFAYEVPGLSRFRVNAYCHLGGVGAVLRVVPSSVPTLDTLNLPPVIRSFCEQRNGLVLVTGPTGSGKSTTLAAMIDFINQNRRGHILTIEDPVEFVHPRKSCLISHREVGLHTENFAGALHSALREDPNVILIGELRDLETISLAITAAETGILVFATLHTNGAVETVDRMVNVFPGGEQPRIRAMLSTSLRGIISQQLVRRADGRGRLAALEILVNNAATSNIIREGRTEQLATAIQSGALLGMQSLDTALRRLLDAKLITGKQAHEKAHNKAVFVQFCEQDEPE